MGGGAIHCRLVELKDLAGTCALMEQIQLRAAGLVARPMYRALCRDALAERNVVIVLAEEQNQFMGLAIAVTNSRRYWRRFVLRRPILGVRIAVRRLLDHFGKLQAPPGPDHGERANAEAMSLMGHWNESAEDIAKTVFIAVLDQYQGRGCAVAIYECLFRVLARIGVSRLDAHVDTGNDSSVRLHSRTGWRIERTEAGYFASIDLSPYA